MKTILALLALTLPALAHAEQRIYRSPQNDSFALDRVEIETFGDYTAMVHLYEANQPLSTCSLRAQSFTDAQSIYRAIGNLGPDEKATCLQIAGRTSRLVLTRVVR